MNSMNYTAAFNCNLRLCSRNEGKIKSYESCRDVRAWSHDVAVRDRYLREWIKCDMPICVLPTSTLARFMRTMTCRSRCRATPRCHPDCKSKVVLESICNSCHAMKECLHNEGDFDKYFDEEEFETSHWPCDRCLEALKSIKMFWKIIIEKIFNISIPKEDDLTHDQCCRTDSVRSVAEVWQTEMMQQALLVKTFSPCIRRNTNFINPCWKGSSVKSEGPPCTAKPCIFRDHSCNDILRVGKPDCKNTCPIKSYKVKSTDTEGLSCPLAIRSNRSCASSRKSKHCTAKANMVDMGCECNIANDHVNVYKTNCEYLQEKNICQKKEIDKLKKEKSSLRIELQNVYKNASWKSTFFTPSRCTSNHDIIAILPKPFECCADDVDKDEVKGIDSEMIITMKNCKNETYRHISLLQVLHKTNDPNIREINLGHACCDKKQDPIELLTKVQNTFGAIVKREMCIANERKANECKGKCAIDATFSKVNASKSAPSCSTINSNESNCLRAFT